MPASAGTTNYAKVCGNQDHQRPVACCYDWSHIDDNDDNIHHYNWDQLQVQCQHAQWVKPVLMHYCSLLKIKCYSTPLPPVLVAKYSYLVICSVTTHLSPPTQHTPVLFLYRLWSTKSIQLISVEHESSLEGTNNEMYQQAIIGACISSSGCLGSKSSLGKK